MHYSNCTAGTFLSRPNRFVAQVALDGRTETCHVKNTGRCRELLIPGCRVYLTRSSQEAVDRAVSIKAGCAQLLYAYIDVEPVTFNRGFYTVDVRYYYRISADALVAGNAVFSAPDPTEAIRALKKEESASNQVLAEIEEVVERAHSQFKNE